MNEPTKCAMPFFSGPWRGEPDHDEWIDEATGLRCHAKRNPSTGTWCGYVHFGPDHRFRRVTDIYAYDMDIHGGVSYFNAAKGVVGFDCEHYLDFAPKIAAQLHLITNRLYNKREVRRYKTLAFVKAECAKLARFVRDFE